MIHNRGMKTRNPNVAVLPAVHERLRKYCDSRPLGAKMTDVVSVAIDAFLDSEEAAARERAASSPDEGVPV